MQIENKLRHEINAADKSFIISNVLKSPSGCCLRNLISEKLKRPHLDYDYTSLSKGKISKRSGS